MLRLHNTKEVGNDIEHCVKSLAFVVLSHKSLHAKQIGQFGLGHCDLRSLILSHKYIVSAIEAALFEEFADQEARKILRTKVRFTGRGRHIDFKISDLNQRLIKERVKLLIKRESN